MDEPKSNPALEAMAALRQQQQPQPQPQQPQQQPTPQQPQQPQIQSQQKQIPQQQPVPAPQKPTQQPVQQSYTPRRSGLGKFLLVIVLLIIIFGGAVGVLASRIYDPLWSPFRPKPEVVLDKMMQNMQNVKSVKTDSKIAISAQSDKSASVSINGFSDIFDKSSPKIDLVLNVVFKDSSLPDSNGFIKAEIIAVNNEFYAKLIDFSESAQMTAGFFGGIDIAKIKGQWIKITQDDLAQNANAISDQRITDFTNKIRDIYSKNKFYFVKQQLSDEKVGDNQVYHYVMSIDNQKLSSVLVDVISEVVKQSSDSMTGSDYIAAAAQGVIQKFLEKIGQIDFDLRIGKKDYMLYGFSLEKTIDLSIFDSSVKEKPTVKISSNYSNYNSQQKVEAPTSYQSVDTAFPQIKNERIKSEMYNLAKEIKLLKSSKGGLTNATCQNSKLKDICDKIKQEAGSYPVINKSVINYCLYIKFPGQENKYYCLDGSLQGGSSNTNPDKSCTRWAFKCPAYIYTPSYLESLQ